MPQELTQKPGSILLSDEELHNFLKVSIRNFLVDERHKTLEQPSTSHALPRYYLPHIVIIITIFLNNAFCYVSSELCRPGG